MKKLLLLTALCLGGCVENDVQFAGGGGARFADWQGRWVLINYWAEWCAPCRKEIPELNELHHGAGGANAVVLGVNYDGLEGDKLTSLIAAMGIEFPVLLADPRSRWGQDLPPVLPTTLVINPAGELAEVLVGPQTLESLSEAVGAETAADAGG